MNVIDKHISGFEQNSYIAELYKLGFKPQEVHKILYEKFEPYFENKKHLDEYIFTPLPSIVETFISITESEEERKLLNEVLSIFRSALKNDPQKCIKAFKNWDNDIFRGISQSVSILNLDRDRSKMNLEDFAKDCFEYVGNFIEVIINAYLRLILQQVSIIKCNSKKFEDIKALDLGVIINSIINEKKLKEIVNPSPWNITLNQWRNIAQHYKYDINNDAIICKYGKFPKEKEIKILKIELWLLVNKLAKIQGVLKVAHHLFILDNKHKYSSLLPHQREKLRKESKILNIFSAISLQGFHFVDYSITHNKTKFILKDLTYDQSKNRQMQILNFLYPIWYNIRTKYLEIEYQNYENKPIFIVKTNTELNQNIFRESLQIGELKMKDVLDAIDMTFYSKN